MNVEEALNEFPQLVRDAYDMPPVEIKEPAHIVFAGMGQSILAGELLVPFIRVPTTVVKQPSLPPFVNAETLVILCDYKGSTEETIHLYNEARRKNAQLFILSSGGKLREACIRDKLPSLKLPALLPECAALPFFFFPLVKGLQRAKLVREMVDGRALARLLESPRLWERAQELSGELVNKIPLIYAPSLFYPVALRWKQQINEHAQVHAFSHAFPELLYNEKEGFEKETQSFHVILLQDEHAPPGIQKNIAETKTFIMEKHVPVTEIAITGKDVFVRLFTALYLGDLVAYELGKA